MVQTVTAGPAVASRARWVPPMAVAVAAAGAVAAVAVHDPFHPGAWPECPFRALTGWYCPFCGSTRAVYALAHGKPALVFTSNPLLPLWALLAVGGWLWWLSRLGPVAAPAGRVRWARAARPVLAVTVAAFWLARNLPGLGVLAPHGHP